MKSVLILSLVILGVTALSEDEAWQDFKVKFERNYRPEEEAARKEIFIKNHRRIEKHNKEGHSWILDHNDFSDKLEKEVLSVVRSQTFPIKKHHAVYKNEEHLRMLADIRQIPKSIDLRNDTCIGRVRYQGGCGSCWAFAAMVPAEYAACKKFGMPVNLSEQQLVDCNWRSGGCHGGWIGNSWDYLVRYGAVTEEAYPYKAKGGRCTYCSSVKESKVIAKPKGWEWAYEGKKPNATQILLNFIAHGPLTVSLQVGGKAWSKFNFLKDGVFDPEDDCQDGGGHAVAIIGYGTDQKSGKDYWIIRNSWGVSWGDGGNFKIRRGINRCNIEYYAAYLWL